MDLMGSRQRKSYTPKYKTDAAHLVIDTGRTIAAVAVMWFVHWRFHIHDLILLAAAGAGSLLLFTLA